MNKFTLLIALLLPLLAAQPLMSQCSITQGGAPIIATDFCSSELPLQFTGSPAGGIFSGPGIFGSGFFNPSAVLLDEPVNTFNITYAAPNGCIATQTFNVHVPQQAIASPTIPSFMCANDEAYPLTGNFDSDGAVFIINGSTIIDEFNPTFWGAGAHQILYTYTQNLGVATCFSYDTVFINVLAAPNTTFSGWLPQYCLSDPPTTLLPTDNSISGVFSGSAGITASSTFDPMLAGVGTHQIIYSYQDISGICANADTVSVSVIDTISADFISLGSPCLGGIDTLIYSGDPAGNNAVFTWAADNADILYDGGDTLVLRWLDTGTQTATLDLSGDVCAGSIVIRHFDISSISVEAGDNQTVINDSPAQLNATAIDSEGGEASFTWSPDMTITCTNCPNPLVSPENSTTYYVTATSQLGCTATDSVRVSVVKQRSLFVPNIFTPNNDGKNDDIKPLGNEIEILKFSIFDRWGALVFQTTNTSDAWDGTINGKNAAAGVYVYVLEITFSDGFDDVYKGSITLVR
ncbi:MAG: gliding motility-associated C-terminal domain-containing protein [Sphingobacteriales bacterium]|nr:gliding motility-associated C-terminal domain-containing protein [Sphingobacteriales bacterium]